VLALEPRTGRTHQLRHQCALRHLPILGDQTYGNFSLNRELARRFGTSRLFLHASSVELQLTLGNLRVDFAARSPVPDEFAAVAGGRLT
jgi:23S rRNA-/tRNA-specific pseudouridylate synthase